MFKFLNKSDITLPYAHVIKKVLKSDFKKVGVFEMTTKNKQKQITIRFSEDDYFKLQVLANKENLTVTQYIRMRSLKRYKNIVIANEALIKKLQEQNDLQEVELQTIKFELIERLATILRRRTS